MAPSKARKSQLIIPTLDPLAGSLRLPATHPFVLKSLSKLSRPSLLTLARSWCSSENVALCGPYVKADNDHAPDDPTVPWDSASTLDELKELYGEELAKRNGSKKEVLDRITEGDWRHGVSLKQIAMADTRTLLDHPLQHQWTALHIARARPGGEAGSEDASKEPEEDEEKLPHINIDTLVHKLHREIAALTRAHYYVHKPECLPITLLRISLFNTPYSNAPLTSNPEAFAHAKVLFVALPHGAPYVYVSLPPQTAAVRSGASAEDDAASTSLLAFVVRALPVAMSRPQSRWALRPTRLSARSLQAMLAMRGADGDSAVAGGWSVYADEKRNTNALDFSNTKDTEPESKEEEKENAKPNTQPVAVRRAPKRAFDHSDPTGHLPVTRQKRLKKLTDGRFGAIGTADDQRVLRSFNVKIIDETKQNNDAERKMTVKLQFNGSNVFAGVRSLAEAGVFDVERLPAWLTGEGNVSVGVIKNGRIRAWDALKT